METDEVKYYQPRFKRWIQSEKWDSIAEELSDSVMNIIEQIMKAEKDGDCSWVIWKSADYALERVREIAKTIN